MVYPPLAGLSAVFVAGLSAVILVRHFCCGLESLSAVFLEGLTELFGERVIFLRIKI